MITKIDQQDEMIKCAKNEKRNVTVFLKSGVRMRGEIIAIDKFTILIMVNDKQQLIYKQAISTLVL